jgi:hypothetical protein
MASEIKSDKLSPSTGTALQIGDASDTITIPTGATFTITDGLGVAGGGTGLTGFTAGDVLYATGTTTLAKLAKGTAEQVLAMNSGATAPDWGSVDLTVLPTITVAKGGTNLSSFTAGDILYATGSTTLAKLAKGSADDVLTMNSGATAPEWAAAAGGGKLLQCVGTSKTDRASTTSTSYTSSGLELAITPTAASSKIVINASVNFYQGGFGIWKVVRDIDGGGYADITGSIGDQVGSNRKRSTTGANLTQMFTPSLTFLDSPSYTLTDVLTYQVQWMTENTITTYLNYKSPDTDHVYHTTNASMIYLMEIGA